MMRAQAKELSDNLPPPNSGSRPFAARDLIVHDVQVDGHLWKFVIDPGTQRWIITTPFAVDVLGRCDGRRGLDAVLSLVRRAYPALRNPRELRDTAMSLNDEGMLFNSEEEHQSASSQVYSDTEAAGIHLEITNRCNLRCSHCYLNSGRSMEHELTFDEIREVIDYLPPDPTHRIFITGGEPLVRRDVYDVLEYAAVSRGVTTDLYTNAVLIDDPAARRLEKISDNASGNLNIQVSLEGLQPQNDLVRGKGSFRRAVRGIEALARHGLSDQVFLFVCLSKHNIHQINKIIDMAEELGVSALKLSQVQKQGRAVDSNFAPTIEEWIGAGEDLLAHHVERPHLTSNLYADLRNGEDNSFRLTNSLFPKLECHLRLVPRIDSVGDVWPCQMFVDPDYVVGNIRRQPLAEILNGNRFQNLFARCCGRAKRIEKCGKCEWKPVCSGGCPGLALSEYGTIMHEDVYCEVRRYWFERYVDFKTHGMRVTTPT